MRVYDLFPFFNELDTLELRFAELDPVVDVFGAVELPVTFTDKPKSMYLDAYKSSSVPGHFYLPETRAGWRKLKAFTPGAYPSGPHPTVDWFQRAQLGQLLHDAEPDDVVILSDVDEIPNRDRVREYIENDTQQPVSLSCRLYYHRVDLFDPNPWVGPVICRRKNLGDAPNMQELRSDRGNFQIIEEGGWHFSWMGTGDAIKTKLAAVDIERENLIYGAYGIKEPPNDAVWLQECYEKGKDIFQRGAQRIRVPIIPGVNQPHEIAAWLEKHPQYAAVDHVAY